MIDTLTSSNHCLIYTRARGLRIREESLQRSAHNYFDSVGAGQEVASLWPSEFGMVWLVFVPTLSSRSPKGGLRGRAALRHLISHPRRIDSEKSQPPGPQAINILGRSVRIDIVTNKRGVGDDAVLGD